MRGIDRFTAPYGARPPLTFAALFLLLALVRAYSAAETTPPGAVTGLAPLKSVHWQDINGRSLELGRPEASRASVFLFVATGCPLCSTYTPRILDAWRQYQPRGVRFYLVDSNEIDTPSVLRRYIRDRQIPFPVLKDSRSTLADWLGADATPEAIVVDQSGLVRYRGRIDDNPDRSRIIRHDLAEALDAVLAGRPVVRPRTIAFGCRIFRDAPVIAAASGAVTYARDVAPILDRNCVFCHRPGESAPFSLVTYQDARAWALPVRDYTARRIMPPWKAAPGFGDFRDARYLSDHEIGIIARWVQAGAPEGDLRQAPTLPHFPPAHAWALGQPDLVLKSTAPFHLPAEGRDIYRQFILPVDWSEDRYLSGIEMRPDNRAVVHHMILYLDPTRKSDTLDRHEKEPGYTVDGVGIFPPGDGPDAIPAQGWAAGNTPSMLHAVTALRVPAHCRLVLQVHYHMDGKPEADNSSVGLHFTQPGRFDKLIRTGALVNSEFVLKPGIPDQMVTRSETVRDNIHVWTVSPHLHMLGRQMQLVATLPGGVKEPLVWVKDWDFNWQENYHYRQPVALPAGTRINLTAVFDNSERNPRQTTHPPREVRWGEQTSDEMCIGFYTYTVDAEHLGPRRTAAVPQMAPATAVASHTGGPTGR